MEGGRERGTEGGGTLMSSSAMSCLASTLESRVPLTVPGPHSYPLHVSVSRVHLSYSDSPHITELL